MAMTKTNMENKFLGRVVVIDASVLVKMFLGESGDELVRKLFRLTNAYKLTIFAPFLLRYELLNILSRKVEDIDKVSKMFEVFNRLKIGFLDASDDYFKNALKEVWADPKISFYDASYAALAKEYGGIFLTADKKYYERAKGGVEMVLI